MFLPTRPLTRTRRLISSHRCEIAGQYLSLFLAMGLGVDYSLTETLNYGDIPDFAVAPNGPEYDDSTLFSSYVIASVASVPPGSTPSVTAVQFGPRNEI